MEDNEQEQLQRCVELTTMAVEGLSVDSLSEESVLSLLRLEKGIDQLLIKQEKQAKKRGNKDKDRALDPPPAKPTGKAATEFDILLHRPKNFNFPVPPLTEATCPGLTEKREGFQIKTKGKPTSEKSSVSRKRK